MGRLSPFGNVRAPDVPRIAPSSPRVPTLFSRSLRQFTASACSGASHFGVSVSPACLTHRAFANRLVGPRRPKKTDERARDAFRTEETDERKTVTETKTLRIVIADDEPIIRLDLKKMLEDCGYDVVGEAADGLKAVEAARNLK